MRGTAWPAGAFRPHGGDGGPPVETITGVLHVRDTLFGHKWVYKLNETRIDARKKLGGNVRGRCVGGVALGVVVGLLVAASVVTVAGPKYLEKLIPKNSSNWTYKLSSRIQNKIKLIFTLQKTQTHNNFKLKNITLEQINSQINLKVPGCENCSKTEICLQNSTQAYPRCVKIKDARDPTGCGGLCQLEVQFCKKLNDTLNIFGCIDIQTLTCDENEWKCRKTLMCIKKNQTCDGVIHCRDKSDEFFCECDLRKNFRCGGNISCIPNNKRCDGSVDCWDASDELKCTGDCGVLNIPCYNGQCIAKEKWCDGIFDCHDKSDEPTGCTNNSTATQVKKSDVASTRPPAIPYTYTFNY